MSKKPWIKALIFLCVFLLIGGMMVSASPADLDLEFGPATTYATTITVDSGLDLGTGGGGIVDGEPVTLRRAINAARGATKPVLIEFDIPIKCDSYDSDLEIWKIELLGIGTGAPANTTFRQLNGDITIDGSTQPGGRTNGPKIILYGHGATGSVNCMVLGETATQGGNVIRGLGFQNFRDSITVSSVNNTIENCWFGLNDAGTAPQLRGDNPASGSGDTGVVLTNITTDGNNNLIQNNRFLGLNGTAATIRGRDNTFRDNWIGMAADGTIENPGCTPESWLGGGGIVVQNRRHLIEGNSFAGLRFDQFDISQPPDAIRVTVDDWANAGHSIVDNSIGRIYIPNPPGRPIRLDVGTCGRGITLNNHMRGTLVENNYITNTSQAGIFINGGVYNQCELRGNILRGTTIEYGEGLPDAFAEYLPAKVTSIDGTSVSGTSGDGSPGPNNKIELFLDFTDSPVEARASLATVTADANGNWQATLDTPLSEGMGIRTTSTSTQSDGIPGMLAGTTTKLSDVLYRPDEDVDISFTDVPEDHPFFAEIGALAASGISTGWEEEDGTFTFRPSLPVTRQAMAAFLARGLELDKDYTVPAEPTFSDVPLGHPFFNQIELLAASGISTGWEEEDGTFTFRPSLPVTRQAMAAFLARGLELDKDYAVPAEPTFSDVPLGHPFFNQIELLAASAISTGYDDGTFRPAAIVTRQAMAAFLVRGLDLD